MNRFSGDTVWRNATETLHRREDFIRAACVLEATAPKVGNVHPSASFDDLTFEHFVVAADCTASAMSELDGVEQLGPAIRSAVRASRIANGTNVNLGIILLLGPILASEPKTDGSKPVWSRNITTTLDQLTPAHGGFIAAAIAEAQPGGMVAEDVDARHPLNLQRVAMGDATPPPYDLMEAMRVSAHRDRIALQYVTGFQDLFESVVPTIWQSVQETGDLTDALVLAHIRLIAESGDSLIARKCGIEESHRVQQMAKRCLQSYGPASIARLDQALRKDGHRFNPGTSADLIAAGLYICLRSWATAPEM